GGGSLPPRRAGVSWASTVPFGSRRATKNRSLSPPTRGDRNGGASPSALRSRNRRCTGRRAPCSWLSVRRRRYERRAVAEAMSDATRPRAARPIRPTSSRARRDTSAPRQTERVPHAPQGLDQGRLHAVDLLAEVADVGLHDGARAAEVVLPDVVEDLALGEHPP